MASLAGVVIKITADTRNAVQGLNRVNTALGKSTSRADKASRAWKAGIGAVTAGAAAFAAAAAVAITAAVEEEGELTKLDSALRGLGFQDSSDDVKAWADDLQYAANVADTDIRNAFETIVRGTKDVAKAQEVTALALDISATTGRDLTSVADALSRAYSGNKTSLGRLNVGLDKAWLKTADMADIVQVLTDRFGGGAEAKAGTLGSAVFGVTNAMDELKESFGAGLIGNVDNANQSLEETEQKLRDLQPAAEDAGGAINWMATQALSSIGRISRGVEDAGSGNGWNAFQSFAEWLTMGAIPDNLFGDVTAGLDGAAGSAADVGDAFDIVAAKAWAARDAIDGVNTALEDTAEFGGLLGQAWDQRGNSGVRVGEALAARRAARRRAAARAKKKRDRVDAVKNAKGRLMTDRLATARTGTHFAASVAAAKAGCS